MNATSADKPPVGPGVARSRRSAQTAAAGQHYWAGASTVACVMTVIIGVRLHEFVPLVHLLQPVILTMVAGFALVFAKSPNAARRAAFAHPLGKLAIVYIGFMTVPFALWPGQAFQTVRSFMPAVVLLLTILMCRPDLRTLQRLQSVFVFSSAVYAHLRGWAVGSRYVGGLSGQRRVLAGALVVSAALVLRNTSPSFRSRMSTLTNLEEDYSTQSEDGRKAVWRRGGADIRQNPVLGVGAGTFPMAEGDYFAVVYSGSRGAKWSQAHNAYIQAPAGLGCSVAQCSWAYWWSA